MLFAGGMLSGGEVGLGVGAQLGFPVPPAACRVLFLLILLAVLHTQLLWAYAQREENVRTQAS